MANCTVYREQGGDSLVVASGGSITCAAGCRLVVPVKTTTGDAAAGTTPNEIVYNSFDNELLAWDGAAWIGGALT